MELHTRTLEPRQSPIILYPEPRNIPKRSTADPVLDSAAFFGNSERAGGPRSADEARTRTEKPFTENASRPLEILILTLEPFTPKSQNNFSAARTPNSRILKQHRCLLQAASAAVPLEKMGITEGKGSVCAPPVG